MSAPGWLVDEFDTHTGLPKGPLALFPVPVEGRLVKALSSLPPKHDPALWQTVALCSEDIADVLRFYNEFLPLAGYDILARGTEHRRTRRFGRSASMQREVLVVRRGIYIGPLYIGRNSDGHTEVDITLAEHTHEEVRAFTADATLRGINHIRWR